MRYVNNIKISVYVKVDEELVEKIKQKIINFIPFNLEEEKIELKEENVQSFNEKIIKIFTIELVKEKHTNDFLKFLNSKLTKEQKMLLLSQKESRLDEEQFFFIRLDKTELVENDRFFITDSGNCVHIRMSIASFPRKRKVALQAIEKIFKE
ncbi:MAG: RNA-binding domain-containing protein [Nanoarchaeota archaeon]